MQLEEKKRAMERDKRKLETQMEKQRQNIGKQAFLQVCYKLDIGRGLINLIIIIIKVVHQQKKQQQQQQTIEPTKIINENIIVEDIESTTTTPRRTLPINQQISPISTNSSSSSSSNNSSSSSIINNENNKTPTLPAVPLLITTTTSNNNNNNNNRFENLKDNSPRKQWDKTPKHIDINETSSSTAVLDSSASTSVNLSKQFYSRDEVLKVIEAAKLNKNKPTTTTVKTLTKDVDGLDAKLNELQTEISRLQIAKQQQQHPILKVTTIQQQQPKEQQNNEATNAFFISFGDENKELKEKPVLKEKQKQEKIIINNGYKESYKQNGFSNEELILSENSDEMERRKEMIIQRQIKRREQLDLIRGKREDERSKQAEEQRLKDEEFNMKKLIERKRKDAIFKAYLDKKKQMQEEIGGVIGLFLFLSLSVSLINYLIKGKPHQHQQKRLKSSQSTHRLLQPTSQNTSACDEFDYTERSHISKSKSLLRLLVRSSTTPPPSPTIRPFSQIRSHFDVCVCFIYNKKNQFSF